LLQLSALGLQLRDLVALLLKLPGDLRWLKLIRVDFVVRLRCASDARTNSRRRSLMWKAAH